MQPQLREEEEAEEPLSSVGSLGENMEEELHILTMNRLLYIAVAYSIFIIAVILMTGVALVQYAEHRETGTFILALGILLLLALCTFRP